MSDVLPFQTTDDVLAQYPAEVRRSTNASIRDAIVQSQLDIALAYSDASTYAASQSDPLTATGIYLDGHGDDRELPRAAGEDDDDYRARFYTTPAGLVTPAGILAAVTAIVAPYTTALPQLVESELDGCFAFSNSGSQIQSYVGTAPFFPDRLYPQDSSFNGGYVRPQSNPGGMLAFDHTIHNPDLGDITSYGRRFMLRIPQLAAADSLLEFVDSSGLLGPFVGDGSNTSGSEASGAIDFFSYAAGVTSKDLYNSICGVVDSSKAYGFRALIFVDPKLI